MPLTVKDRPEPKTEAGIPQPVAGRHLPLGVPTWSWVAILAGIDIVTTIVGLARGDHEGNPIATVVGGVSVFLALKFALTAVMCWRWRRLGEKHWSTLSRVIVLGLMASVVCWNIAVIAMR